MKKYFIGMSVLALAACGGGGSGGGAIVDSGIAPMELGTQYSRVACNQTRTECRGINTDSRGNIIVAAQRFSTQNLARATTTHGQVRVNDENWDIFYADDIDMNVLYTPGKIAKQTFIVGDDGKIEGLKWSGDEHVAEYVPGVFLSGMEYIGNNKFSLKSPESSGTAEYANYADLHFANFGVVKLRNMVWDGYDIGDGNMDVPFAGGYDVLKQNPAGDLANQVITYTGTARGMVEYAGTMSSDAAQDYLNITANGATLELDTTGAGVVETFTGNFVDSNDPSKHWYTVQATKNNGVISYNFSGDNNTGRDRFNIDGTHPTIQKFETGYYSDIKNEAAEASGLFQYQEMIDPTLTDNNSNPQIEENNKTIYFGFGGKN